MVGSTFVYKVFDAPSCQEVGTRIGAMTGWLKAGTGLTEAESGSSQQQATPRGSATFFWLLQAPALTHASPHTYTRGFIKAEVSSSFPR